MRFEGNSIWLDIPQEKLSEIFKRLNNVEEKLRKKIATKALRKAGQPMVKAAKALAPVRTGALRRSIRIRRDKSKAIRRMKNFVALKISGGVKYAVAVEFGHGSAPPRPFLRPAFDAHAESCLRLLCSELEVQLIEAVKQEARGEK